jgi:DNA-binding response OmpR family regulator
MNSEATILVVDDEAGIRFYLQETLERDGYQVVTADSGEQALNYIEGQEFDLALIDLKMEGVGGMEVLTALRQRAPDTAIIVLTGHASLETAVETLRQGAHDYLFKPCKTVELRESVRRGLLKRQQALQQRELITRLTRGAEQADLASSQLTAAPNGDQARFLRSGGLIVDLMRHIITLDGYLLELSPTEFDLLAYLISEAPRVIDPQELVKEVQGYTTDRLEAGDVVRYHIYRIRRKIATASGRKDIIRTVRGVGYTIDE